MSKLFKNKNINLIFACLFAVVLLIGSLFVSPSVFRTTNAETSSTALQTNQNFTICVTDRKTGKESTKFSTANLTFGKCFIYNWSEIKEMKFVYNPDEASAPPKKYKNEAKPETEYYDVSVSIDYLKGYRDVGVFYQGDTKSFASVYSTTVSGIDSYKTLKNNLPKDFVYIPDDGKSTLINNEKVSISGWGIYRFKLLINGQETYSDYFVIEPDFEINKVPEITYETESSDSSWHSNYRFKIKNASDFAYVDKKCLVWYVTGKSTEGILYVLAKEDCKLEQFKNKGYEGLYPTYENENRIGTEFLFDDKDTSGTWNVWCEYNYHNSSEKPLTSKTVTIETGTRINLGIIIGVVAGSFVLAIVTAILISVRKMKKDKVY